MDSATPSASAVALATQMRTFDATLTDAQVAAIARGIDEQRALGLQLAPKSKALRNGDEPLTSARVPGLS